MPQETFWRHDHEGLAPRTQRLTPKAMIVLRGSSWINDLDVVIRCEMKETLQSGAGVFWALAFVPVRQQENQATQPLPFLFRAGDELVHYRLGGIPEISVLRLPQNETIGIVQAVTVFETKHTRFRKGAIENLDRGLIGRQVLERRVGMAILIIVQHSMPLAEGPAFSVLTCHAHAKSVA